MVESLEEVVFDMQLYCCLEIIGLIHPRACPVFLPSMYVQASRRVVGALHRYPVPLQASFKVIIHLHCGIDEPN